MTFKEFEGRVERGTITKREVDKFIKELKTKTKRGHLE